MKYPKFLLAAIALSISVASFSQVDSTKKDTTTQKTDTTKKKDPRLTESATSSAQDQQPTATQPATTTTATPAETTNAATTNAASSTTTNATTSAASSNPASASATTPAGGSTIAKSNVPKPNFGRYYIPVLGSYTATAATTENKSITVKGDETNPGKIWIEGLAGTKFYALLKAVPGTYKVPAQKQDENSIAEGTVVYDENSKQINLCLGCGYNDQAPAVSETSTEAVTPEATTKDKNDHHANKAKVAPVKANTIVTFTGTKSDQGTVSILQ